NLHSLRDGYALRAWIARVVVSRATRRLRRRRLLRALGFDAADDEVTLRSQAARDAGPEVLADLARLDRVLRELPAPVRAAWVLHRVEGCTLPEAAAACGCSLATVKRRVGEGDARVARWVRVADGA